ncbi:hypothetical protein T439DRAFT_148676 [Meredithblackwellia eburnea MCA 4105]
MSSLLARHQRGDFRLHRPRSPTLLRHQAITLGARSLSDSEDDAEGLQAYLSPAHSPSPPSKIHSPLVPSPQLVENNTDKVSHKAIKGVYINLEKEILEDFASIKRWKQFARPPNFEVLRHQHESAIIDEIKKLSSLLIDEIKKLSSLLNSKGESNVLDWETEVANFVLKREESFTGNATPHTLTQTPADQAVLNAHFDQMKILWIQCLEGVKSSPISASALKESWDRVLDVLVNNPSASAPWPTRHLDPIVDNAFLSICSLLESTRKDIKAWHYDRSDQMKQRDALTKLESGTLSQAETQHQLEIFYSTNASCKQVNELQDQLSDQTSMELGRSFAYRPQQWFRRRQDPVYFSLGQQLSNNLRDWKSDPKILEEGCFGQILILSKAATKWITYRHSNFASDSEPRRTAAKKFEDEEIRSNSNLYNYREAVCSWLRLMVYVVEGTEIPTLESLEVVSKDIAEMEAKVREKRRAEEKDGKPATRLMGDGDAISKSIGLAQCSAAKIVWEWLEMKKRQGTA